MNTVVEYMRLADDLMKAYPMLRRGQALYNVLDEGLREEINGTDLDPFYDDNLVEDFLTWLEGRLQEMNEESVK